MAFSFPSDIYRQLLGVDFRILDELTFLSKQQAKRSPSGSHYCFPSRHYLATKLGCCIRTVSRSIARLKRLGILDAIQRRPVRGIWKTNLYKVKHWLGWRLGQLSHLLRKPLHRGTQKAHKAFRERKIETLGGKSPPPPPPKTENEALTPSLLKKIPLLQTWIERGKQETPSPEA